MSDLYVPKRYDNYSDVLIAFGILKMVNSVINTSDRGRTIISDDGEYFIVHTDVDLKEVDFSKVKFQFLLPYIEQNTKTRPPKPPDWASSNFRATNPDKDFNEYTREDHIASNLQKSQQGLRAKDGMNEMCELLYKTRENFGVLIEALILGYTDFEPDLSLMKEKVEYFDEELAKFLFKKRNALQALFPHGCKGFNYEDLGVSTGITTSQDRGRQEIYYYELLLASIGLWETAVFFPVFTNQGKESILISILNPKHINYTNYKITRDSIRGFWAGTSTKYSALILLTAIRALIDRSEELREEEEFEGYQPYDFINSIETASFRSLGSSYVPFTIAKFVIPVWVFIDDEINTTELKESIQDIINLLIPLNEEAAGIGVFIEIIRFLNSNNPLDLLNFFYEYNLFRISQIADNKRIRSYSQKTLEVVMNRLDKTNKTQYSEILKNEGFKNIAKAIRNVAVNAIYLARRNDEYKKIIYFGLASELKRASLTEKTLIEWLNNFCSTYNANLDRFAFANPDKKLPFSKIKQDDIEQMMNLIEDYSQPRIVGGLLLAYGLASTSKKEEVDTEVEETIE